MNKVRVILIEDDPKACERFEVLSVDYRNIEIIKITNSSTDAIASINELNPHAIILDLELDYGEGSGLDVLNAIETGEIKFKPFIIITTNNPSTIISSYARQCGSDFICKKYQQGYSEKQVLNYLSLLREQIIDNINYSKNTTQVSYHNASTENYIRQIFKELNLLGMSAKNIGFKYLEEAILFVIEDSNANFIKELHLKYNKTEDSIKKAMQHSINRTWSRQAIDILFENYTGSINQNSGSPTLTDFVHYYARKVKIS